MKASAFEYRFRVAIQAVIYVLGFAAPWLYVSVAPAGQGIDEPAWLGLSTLLYRQGWLTYSAAVMVLLVLALVFTGLGAWLRTWGRAYDGPGLDASGRLAVDGPYRRTRNPLYLGMMLHVLGISLLMPPSGAVLAIVLLWAFQVRLALYEEATLTARLGAPYVAYCAAVPRFLPSPAAQVAAAGGRPHWVRAVLGELYFVLAFVVLAVFGWGFDKTTIRRGMLISLGVWLVALAFLPRAKREG